MQIMRQITWISALLYANLAMGTNTQIAMTLNCQALVSVTQPETETRKLIEDFEFFLNQNTMSFNFLIAGNTNIKLAIHNRSHTDLENNKITQQINLEDRVWTFEFAQGDGPQREHIQSHWDSLSGEFNYERSAQGIRIDAKGHCKRRLQPGRPFSSVQN